MEQLSPRVTTTEAYTLSGVQAAILSSWATATEPALQSPCSATREATAMGSPHTTQRVALTGCNQRKPLGSNKDPAWQRERERETGVDSITCMLICSVASDSLRPYGLQPARLPCPWDFSGKTTGVGCHFLLQGIFLTKAIKPMSPRQPYMESYFLGLLQKLLSRKLLIPRSNSYPTVSLFSYISSLNFHQSHTST